MKSKHIYSWIEFYKNYFLNQEIFPNRYNAIFYFILKICNFRLDKKIAFIPCGKFAEEFTKKYKNPNFYFFDEIEKDIDNFHFLDNNKTLEKMDYIFILTKKHEDAILKKIPHKISKKFIKIGNIVEEAEFQKYLDKNISNFSFLKFIICLKNSYQSPLSILVKNDEKLLFVRQNCYSDVKDKVNIISNTLNARTIYESNEMSSPKVNNDCIKSRLIDIIVVFLQNYRKKKEIIFFIPIVMDGYGLTYILKQKFSKVKMISNFTDYIYDLCKYEYRSFLSENYNWDMKYTEAEYFFAHKIMHTKIVDAIIHRHGNSDTSWTKRYKSANKFFPPYLNTYPKKQSELKEKKSLVFIGTVHSAKYDSELFSCIFLEDLFKVFIKEGFKIDLYYSKGYEKQAEEYTRKIDSKYFRAIKGMPLDELLPKINGKYTWGLMLNDLSKDEKNINTNYKYTIPTKIYTYMSINLPILSYSSKNDCTIELIETSGIGKVLNEQDLKNLSGAIEVLDIEIFEKNIKEFNMHNNLNTQKKHLESFIKGNLH